MTGFAYTGPQWSKIKAVVSKRLRRDDADQIEVTRPASKLMQMVGTLTTTTSLRSCIETAASLHIADSAVHGQTPGYKARITKLEAMKARANTLHKDLMDAIKPTFTVGDGDVRRIIHGGDRAAYPNVDLFDETGSAFATVRSVIDASIAACRPQETANTSKTGRDRFWNEMLAIWISIGGKETGTDAAEFIAATSRPVFDRVRAIGGSKTAVSTTVVSTVIEWLRVRKAQQAATS